MKFYILLKTSSFQFSNPQGINVIMVSKWVTIPYDLYKSLMEVKKKVTTNQNRELSLASPPHKELSISEVGVVVAPPTTHHAGSTVGDSPPVVGGRRSSRLTRGRENPLHLSERVGVEKRQLPVKKKGKQNKEISLPPPGIPLKKSKIDASWKNYFSPNSL